MINTISINRFGIQFLFFGFIKLYEVGYCFIENHRNKTKNIFNRVTKATRVHVARGAIQAHLAQGVPLACLDPQGRLEQMDPRVILDYQAGRYDKQYSLEI